MSIAFAHASKVRKKKNKTLEDLVFWFSIVYDF